MPVRMATHSQSTRMNGAPDVTWGTRRKKRKHCVRVGQPLRVWTAANQEWAPDFVHDAVECTSRADMPSWEGGPSMAALAVGPSSAQNVIFACN
jgi:hypothetical protein